MNQLSGLACEQALVFGQAKRASRERASESPAPRGFAARSRVPARLASLAQIGGLARRLCPVKLLASPKFVRCCVIVASRLRWKTNSIKGNYARKINNIFSPISWVLSCRQRTSSWRASATITTSWSEEKWRNNNKQTLTFLTLNIARSLHLHRQPKDNPWCHW